MWRCASASLRWLSSARPMLPPASANSARCGVSGGLPYAATTSMKIAISKTRRTAERIADFAKVGQRASHSSPAGASRGLERRTASGEGFASASSIPAQHRGGGGRHAACPPALLHHAFVRRLDVALLGDGFQPDVESPQQREMLHRVLEVLRQGPVIAPEIAQRQRPVAAEVDVGDLDVRFTLRQRVLARQGFPHGAIAFVVVDGADLEAELGFVVNQAEQPEIPDQLRRKKLRDEAFVLEIPHGEIQGLLPVAAGY